MYSFYKQYMCPGVIIIKNSAANTIYNCSNCIYVLSTTYTNMENNNKCTIVKFEFQNLRVSRYFCRGKSWDLHQSTNLQTSQMIVHSLLIKQSLWTYFELVDWLNCTLRAVKFSLYVLILLEEKKNYIYRNSGPSFFSKWMKTWVGRKLEISPSPTSCMSSKRHGSSYYIYISIRE